MYNKGMNAIFNRIDALTHAGELVQEEGEGALRCVACAHRCLIKPGRRGVCQVRFNQGGELRVPWGYVAACQIDPIEKKPFSHFFPGSDALTFGMLGCDLHCAYCQNWVTSQVGREEQSEWAASAIQTVTAEQLVALAVRSGAKAIVSSYNEPLITSEWAVNIFKQAKAAGLHCAFVSNGNATPEVLAYLRPYLTAYKIDLKSMQDRQYRQLGCVLNNVLDSIRLAHELGLWVEVVTLVVPDFNDSPSELWDAAQFIASISRDIPWHVTGFHPDYKMDGVPTPAETLRTAVEIGQEAGLRYVYAGNLPGKVGGYENTVCPNCQQTLIQRNGYTLRSYTLTADGKCPHCGTKIVGMWTENPAEVRLGGVGVPRSMRIEKP